MSESDPSPSSAESSALGERAATAPFQLTQEPITPQGEAAAPTPGASPAPAFEHLGELPASYGTQSLYLVAYDPRQLFAYWDVDWSKAGAASFALKVLREDGAVETRLELAPRETSRYIRIGQAGGRYSVELTSRGRDGQWRALATSGPVTMPPEGIAQETEPTFATLPFHLSFQRLVDLLHGAMRPNEDLTDVLARLQTGGHVAASSLLGALGGLGQDQLRTLELLLSEGIDLLETPAQTSGGLSSPGSSPFGQFAAGSSENLSSGALNSEVRLAAAAAGAEALSSGALGSQGRWLAGGPAGGLGSETLSSRLPGPLFAAGGMGSESLTSQILARRAMYFAAGSSENLTSGGLTSGAYAAAAARGSEILGSAARPGFGVSSEAWRRAGGAATGSSETLASSQSSMFLRAMETNLDVLGSLFSAVHSQINGDLGGSSSSSSSLASW